MRDEQAFAAARARIARALLEKPRWRVADDTCHHVRSSGFATHRITKNPAKSGVPCDASIALKYASPHPPWLHRSIGSDKQNDVLLRCVNSIECANRKSTAFGLPRIMNWKRRMTRRARVGGLLALALAIFVAVRWLEPAPTSSDSSAGASSRIAGQAASPASGAPGADVDARTRSSPMVQSPGLPPASADASAPAVPKLTVQVPASAQVGDVFSFAVHIDTHELVGRIAIMLEYDFKRLELKSAREGNFVKTLGRPTPILGGRAKRRKGDRQSPGGGRHASRLRIRQHRRPGIRGKGARAGTDRNAKHHFVSYSGRDFSSRAARMADPDIHQLTLRIRRLAATLLDRDRSFVRRRHIRGVLATVLDVSDTLNRER